MLMQSLAINSVGQTWGGGIKRHSRDSKEIRKKYDTEGNEAKLIKNKFYTCLKLLNNRFF